MSKLSATSHLSIPNQRRGSLSQIFCQAILGSVGLASSVLFGVWTLYIHPAVPDALEPPATGPAAPIASNPYGALSDPRLVWNSAPASLTQSFSLEASLEPFQPAPTVATAEPKNDVPVPVPVVRQPGESVPLPIPRPADSRLSERAGPPPAYSRRFVQQDTRPAVPTAPTDIGSFFEQIFGLTQPAGRVLANASPQGAVSSNARGLAAKASAGYDRWTAVYDIAARTVYMPNGTRLEAHSGLGNMLDDPRYVHTRMRGATPPNVYALQPREQLFHGVQALRLIPIGNGELYGRDGLLAHTYMLGANGDSNGCVSFKNYDAFLQAYQNGEIKRLAVVASLN
jgi:hypothetical protein